MPGICTTCHRLSPWRFRWGQGSICQDCLIDGVILLYKLTDLNKIERDQIADALAAERASVPTS